MAALLISVPSRATEPGRSSAPYLLIDYGAGAAAMGGAATGGPIEQDVLFYNPAALALIDRRAIGLQHIEDATGDNIERIDYVHPLGNRFGIGVSSSFIYFVDAIRTEFETLDRFTNYDVSVGLSLGYRVNSALAVGGTIKYLKERVFVHDASTVAVDLSLLWQTPLRGLSVGYAHKDMGPGLRFFGRAVPLPTSDRFGLALQRPGSGWRFALDATRVSGQKLRIGYGAQREVGRYLALRAGYRVNYDGVSADGPTAGLAVRYGDLALDYAYIPSQDIFTLGATHRIQSVLNFGPLRETTPLTPIIPMRRPRALAPFHGTMILGSRTTQIANHRIIGYTPGWTPRVDVFSVGEFGRAEATVGASLYHDRWDGYTARRVSASFRQDALTLNAGDFIAQMSPYTMIGRDMRGAEASFTADRKLRPIAVPTGAELRGARGKPINVARLLKLSGIGKDRFRTSTVRALAGQTAKALNVGEKVEALNGVRATYGTYEQFGYGAEVTSEVMHGSRVTLRTVHVADDPASLYAQGVTRPLENTVASVHAEKIFPSGRTVIDGEAAYSLHDRDAISALTPTVNDIAANIRWKTTRKRWDLEAAYEQLGPDYDLAGNLSMRSLHDRKGPRARGSYEFDPKVRLRFDGMAYRDNLDRKKPFTTSTADGGAAIDVAFTSDLALTLGYRRRDDRSERARDTSTALQQLNTSNNLVHSSFRAPLGPYSATVGFSSSENTNRNRYLPGIAVGGYEILTWTASLNGPIAKKANFSLAYARTLMRLEIPNTRTVYEQWNGRVDALKIYRKIDLHLTGLLVTNNGQSQRERRREFGIGIHSPLSEDSIFDAEFRRIEDVYTPSSSLLDFAASVVDVRLTRTF